MSCENCKCHITPEIIREMDYKRANELINELESGTVCQDTVDRIQNMMKENKKM